MSNVIFVLDKSGSMTQCSDSVISGFNEFVQNQKSDRTVDMKTTLITFSDNVDVVYDKKPISEVKLLTKENYCPNGMTALNDAIGKALEGNEKSLVVIITDGEENSSKKYTHTRIQEMIKQKADEDWKFIYLCNDLKTSQAGEKLGFQKSANASPTTQNLSVDPSEFGLVLNRHISKAVTSYRRSGSVENIEHT